MLGDRSAGAAILAGPLVRKACARHLADRARWADGRGPYRFSAGHADLVLEFFESVLHLPDTADDDGREKRFLLEPMQAFVVGSLFGWVDSRGYRRFREAYIETGKGNGKTPLLAGIGVFGLTSDGELSPEVYAVAVTRDQANILYRYAAQMIECSPELRSRIVKTGEKVVINLYDPETRGFFRPFSREQGLHSGPRIHMALIDEVHEHPTGEVIHKARASGKGRRQPLFIEITNSGVDRFSICWAHHEHARQVLEGALDDDRHFAYVCNLDEADDPLTDPACWPKTNPLLDVSVTREYLARQVENARNIKVETNSVLRLNFCVWTQATTRFYNVEQWRACERVLADEELLDLPCYAGVDLGKSDDFSAFVLRWSLPDGGIAVRSWFWVPGGAIEKYPTRPWDQFRAAGALEVLEGYDVMDYDVIEPVIVELCDRWRVLQVGYDDRYAHQLRIHLEAEGIEMVKVAQGYNLNEALSHLGDLVVQGKVAHDGNTVLTWMADNLVVRKGSQGEIRPDKERSAEKIDGQVALTMAEDCAIRVGLDDRAASRELEDRGLL